MSTDFHIIIPARYHSSRLPGKLLRKINGQSVIERVYMQALQAAPKSIIIATDHEKIATHAKTFGAEVMMTAITHPSGTDRIAEVIAKKRYDTDAIVVNVQGDEPFIEPLLIQQIASLLAISKAPVATLCWPLENFEQLHNPNVVKVVRDCHNDALYFSRNPIPAHRDEPQNIQNVYRHIGIYAYRAGFLLDFVRAPVCDLERCEALEQLRILWLGYKIHVDVACVSPHQDINTYEDLRQARKLKLS